MIHQRLKCKRKAEFPININKSERKLNHNRKIKGVEQKKREKKRKGRKGNSLQHTLDSYAMSKGDAFSCKQFNSNKPWEGKKKKKENCHV